MVAGHLQEKNGYYYIVLNLKDELNNRKVKWVSTGLEVKRGNKKQAEKLLMEERQKYTCPQQPGSRNMLFADYMLYWLKIVKPDIELDTYSSYQKTIENRIVPYFKARGTTLTGLTAADIQEFYSYCRNDRGISNNTVIHYHANISAALNYALDKDFIAHNPMAKVKRPKHIKYTASYYSIDEMERLFECIRGDGVEFPVLMAAFYGMRRSEIAGLRWRDIDFANNTISIAHTVIQTNVDGQAIIVSKDRAKNKTSCRTLPLVPQFKELLLKIKARQEYYEKFCGNCYHKSEYIYVNELGIPIKPNYITQHFALVLEKNSLRRIRFHDLRHSCASLLLKNGVSMKDIQAWLGHSTYNTTAELYAHLDSDAKNQTGIAMARAMDISTVLLPATTADPARIEERTGI